MDEEGGSPSPSNSSSVGGGSDDYYNNYHYGGNTEYDSLYHQCGLTSIPYQPEFRAAQKTTRWLYPPLLVAGLLGNGMSVVILWRLSVKVWSTCLYLALLALVDTLVLTIRCGSTWLQQISGGANPSVTLMGWSDATCKCYLFALNVLQQLWPWLTVALAVDLTVVTAASPLTTYSACTRERARVTALLITILLLCLNLHFFWTWGLRDGLCMYVEEFSLQFLNLVWPSIETTVQHLLPLIVVAVCLLISIVGLLRKRKGKGPAASSDDPADLRRYFLDLRSLRQLQKACLVLGLMFVWVKAFTFALELVNVLELKGVIVVPCRRYARFYASFVLVQAVRDVCVYSFHSLKFLVYLGLCAGFRRRFVTIFTRCLFLCRGRTQDVERGPRPECDCLVKNRHPDP